MLNKLIIQIPCFNEEKTLALALKSLPREVEGFKKVEWLIINDGSTDDTVKVALECGVDHIVNFKQNQGLARGFMAGIDACLKHGADVEMQDGSGRTPLHWAAVAGALEAARLLIDSQVNVNVTTKSGSTPLHMASEAGKAHFVAWLLSQNADITLRDGPAGDGMTAYEMAKQRQHKEVMALLAPKGGSVFTSFSTALRSCFSCLKC